MHFLRHLAAIGRIGEDDLVLVLLGHVLAVHFQRVGQLQIGGAELELHEIVLALQVLDLALFLGELDLENEGVSVRAVRRKTASADYVQLSLTSELKLEANDILVISGNSEATDLAEAKLL